MTFVKVYNLDTNTYNDWVLPSKEKIHNNMKDTWGSQYDKIEREIVTGGIPMLLKRK